jgi:peptidoglycan/xylan/chitin deacetylase (PgdA/CDA1 family)
MFKLLVFLFSFSALAQTCDDTGSSTQAQILRSLRGLDCRNRNIHLTFDDGPVSGVTAPLLDHLKRLNVPSTFFVSTTRLASGAPNAQQSRQTLQRMLRDGHVVANHSHDHDAFDLRMDASGRVLSPGMSEAEKAEQLRVSESLLNLATNGAFARQPLRLFRFPYGRGVLPSDRELDELEKKGMRFSGSDRVSRVREYRRQSEALAAIADQRYTHFLWNHDSGDSRITKTDLTSSELTSFITENVQGYCARGRPSDQISLFHDTKNFVVQAIPMIVEISRCLGAQFVSAERIMQSQRLREQETIITPAMLSRAPVDAMGELIQSLSLGCDNCMPTQTPVPAGACLSEYDGKIYPHCSGGAVSICYRGSWFSRANGEKENLCAGEGL